MSERPYSLSDLDSDLRHFVDLFQVIASEFYEVDFTDAPKGLVDSLNKIGSLIWIGRDHIEACQARLEQNFSAFRSEAVTVNKPADDTPVQALFKLWIQQRDKANAQAEIVNVDPGELFSSANATGKLILDMPALTLRDMAAKLIAATDHGAYMDLAGFDGGPALLQEAAGLVGRADHLEGGSK